MREIVVKLIMEGDKPSSMRLMSIFSLLVGAGIAIYGIYQGKDLTGVAQICAVFVGAAFVGKTAQKFAE